MKPIFQTKFGDGIGNCLQAALASLFEVELDKIPNFVEYGDQFYPQYWKWQKENNIHFESMKSAPIGYCLMIVKSPRINAYHALVALDGKPVHDPYPNGNCEFIGEPRYEWMTIIDPSKPIGLINA